MRLEQEATGGELDWGWHWPLELVKRGLIERDRSGKTPNPYDLMNIPETWFQDLDQMDGLREFATWEPKED